MQQLRPIEHLKKYLEYGAYPFYRESLENYSSKLLEVINLTIGSDLSGIYGIDPSKLDKNLRSCFTCCARLTLLS
jgi:hypothetical protein